MEITAIYFNGLTFYNFTYHNYTFTDKELIELTK